MAAYTVRRVYGVIQFTSPAGCLYTGSLGSAPGPTLGNEYGRTLLFLRVTTGDARTGELRRESHNDTRRTSWGLDHH